MEPCFVPVIARLDGLDYQIQLLEEKRSENGCKTLSSALQEVHHKGTLLERLAMLEKRVLELSLEIDQGNTSRSSSSTVHGPEMTGCGKDSVPTIPKRKDRNGDATTATQQMEDPSTIQAQEERASSPAEGTTVKQTTASGRSPRQKKKTHKNWPWLFRHTC